MHKVRLETKQLNNDQIDSIRKFGQMASEKWCQDMNTNTFYFDCEEDAILFRMIVG